MSLRAFGAFLLSALTSHAATREAYVWQRQAGPEVTAALTAFQAQLDGCCVLAAEVAWTGGRMQVVRPPVDFTALKAWGKPVGLAVRIGAYGGKFAADDATSRALGDLAVDVVARARAAGLVVAELQVDFDAAESKIAGYRTWLTAWRLRLKETPLVFTALPAWLKHAEFRQLARAASGFVLQVHSLEKPAGPDAPFTLCDPVRAMAWVRQADAAGVPFRVALPTYGYVLAFDAAGKFLALSAEGPRRSWPKGTQLRVVRADAAAMTRLARTITAAALPSCTGVIWFRLPVAGDRINWDAITFATVLRGDVPVQRLDARVSWPEPRLAEISIRNAGETTEPLPRTVTLRWSDGARVVAADGISGFFLETRGGHAQGIVRAAEVPADASIAPGRETKIAWLRFEHDVSLDAVLPAPP
ncbi:DUF3142 domain-containing protein [Horticoccus sp. 23ND18S-11]|uniref:DUF3142 domain-containing protein n=1 Tax=Horticoccus sp. 23ND18S-11 TaxID=3391832 RepID=UPI0039C93787